MHSFWPWLLVGLAAALHLREFKKYSRDRYRPYRPHETWPFAVRLESAFKGWWIPLFMYCSFFGFAIFVAFLYGAFSNQLGYWSHFANGWWKLASFLAVNGCVVEVEKNLAALQSQSLSFEEVIIRLNSESKR